MRLDMSTPAPDFHRLDLRHARHTQKKCHPRKANDTMITLINFARLKRLETYGSVLPFKMARVNINFGLIFELKIASFIAQNFCTR